MTPTEAMNAIESRRFAALTNLASNLKTFLRIAGQQPEVEALSRAMATDPPVITDVLQRAQKLSAVGADAEHESEADSALATYLWLLSSRRPDLMHTAVSSLRNWGCFFWARRVADHVCVPAGSANGNGHQARAETGRETPARPEPLHRQP